MRRLSTHIVRAESNEKEFSAKRKFLMISSTLNNKMVFGTKFYLTVEIKIEYLYISINTNRSYKIGTYAIVFVRKLICIEKLCMYLGVSMEDYKYVYMELPPLTSYADTRTFVFLMKNSKV